MYNTINACPVCDGDKKIKYKTNHMYGHREVETKCWACRGTGLANYKQGIDITESRIEDMHESLTI